MKRIGLIGVGEIGRALMSGLCDGPDDPPEIFLSPRGASVAAELSGRFQSAQICANNQEGVDRSDVVVIAVRSHDRPELLRNLAVNDGKVLVTVMAGVRIAEMRQLLGTDAPVIRAIPLPAVRHRRGITATYPSRRHVDLLFEHLGGVLQVAGEDALDVFSALTGTLASHPLRLPVDTHVMSHRPRHPPNQANAYVRGVVLGLIRPLNDKMRTIADLAADHETPGGLNERLRTT